MRMTKMTFSATHYRTYGLKMWLKKPLIECGVKIRLCFDRAQYERVFTLTTDLLATQILNLAASIRYFFNLPYTARGVKPIAAATSLTSPRCVCKA